MWTLAVLMSLSTCGVHEFCREKLKFTLTPRSMSSRWFCIHKLSMFIYLSMEIPLADILHHLKNDPHPQHKDVLETLYMTIFFLKRFFLSSRHDLVDTIKSQNFFIAQVWCCRGYLYWSARGCNLAAHSSVHCWKL